MNSARLEHHRPDWRGFGLSDWLSRPYFFAEHIGDLEPSSTAMRRKGKVRIAGHSMGGIIACLYAGIRPERIESLVSLEGFGIAPHAPEMAPERYQQWLDTLQRPPHMHVYQDRAAFARRLLHTDRFLTPERAEFLQAPRPHRRRRKQGRPAPPWHHLERRSVAQGACPLPVPPGGIDGRLAADHLSGALGRRPRLLDHPRLRHPPRRLGSTPGLLRQPERGVDREHRPHAASRSAGRGRAADRGLVRQINRWLRSTRILRRFSGFRPAPAGPAPGLTGGVNRDGDDELRGLVAGMNGNGAAVRGDDRAGDGQPQSAALVVRAQANEAIEDRAECVGGIGGPELVTVMTANSG
ncbi:MAG: alpha/beta fold hydrolase [Dechloromonas sp.]|uniref:Alpha/beta fold hydrolase n=1 Tax=Candidatus Dechloromonas phosphorivorans TaxID=2899244 RepID=A0A9D7LP48_9RHOO|nr:alpha/beta fold hydrolase [Candidatus Dechloromonas phosphorivorans]